MNPPRARSSRLLDKFRATTDERLRRIRTTIIELCDQDDVETRTVVVRDLHTLKGEAKLLGFDAISRLAHFLEELWEKAAENGLEADAPAVVALLAGCDCVHDVLAFEPDDAAAGSTVDSFIAARSELPEGGREGAVAAKAPDPPASEASAPQASAPQASAPGAPPPAPPEPPPSSRAASPASAAMSDGGRRRMTAIRVDVEQLEDVARVAEEIRLSHSLVVRWFDVLDKVYAESEEVLRDLRNASAHSNQGASSSMVHEIVSSARNRQELLLRRLAETRNRLAEGISALQSGVTTMEASVHHLRLVAVGALFDAYPTAVRALARDQSKEVNLIVEGASVEIDAHVLERIEEPLLHVMRNAVDHGVELPSERRAAGKRAQATVRISARQQGTHVCITVEDDGRGVDDSAVATIARRRGIATQTARFEAADVERLLFTPGFSTRDEVSEVSGRGVGLDIVRREVDALGGDVSFSSQPGRGTRVELKVPTSVIRAPLLLVEVAGALFGLPSGQIHGFVDAPTQEIDLTGGRPTVVIQGRRWPIETLPRLLELPAEDDGETSLILVEHKGRRLAIAAERVLREETVILRRTGHLLAGLPILTSTALSRDGRLVQVLDTIELLRSAAGQGAERAPDGATPTARRHRIMVVDDSELTRDMLVALVTGAGFEVTEAVDGKEALAKLERRRPDLVLTDLEMPVMNGFELLEAVRASDAYRELPVVVCSTRGAESDKRRAAELGADAYVVKAEFSADYFIDTLVRFLPKETS